MLTLKEYAEMAEHAVAAVRFPEGPETLYDPIRYALSAGGKRLRPVLVLSVADAFCHAPESALSQAVGIEIFHNFTLLHDDVMDNADVRRGRPAVHKVWNESAAILSGDAMLTLSGMIVTQGCDGERLDKVLRLFNKTAMEVYAGQQYDMDFETRTDVTVDEYMEMIRLKTSVLLGCACALGAIMGSASDADVKAIYSYGEKLGLAFQLQDDYLDTFGDPKVFGKAIGGDILNDKKTWLLITALSEAPEEVKGAMALTDPAEKIESVKAIYDALDLPSRCHRLIDRFVEEACAGLEGLPMSTEAKEFFAGIAYGSRTRTH